MKRSFACVALLSMALATGVVTAQEYHPTAQETASIAYICKGWRPLAKDIYEMKVAGQPKPKPTSPLHAKIIDEIYYAKSSITSESMAEAVAEQVCVPMTKEKFRTGAMRVKN